MKCLAAAFVNYCVVMCDVVWSVYLCFSCFVCGLFLACLIVFGCPL